MNGTINSTISKEEEESSSQSEVEDGINTKLYVLASIIVLTLLGNVLIMILVTCRRDNPMTRVQFFMLHLSIADVCTALFTILPEFIWHWTGEFYGGNVVCKSVKFLQMVGPYLSSYVLTMMAIDRFQAICYPLTNQVWTTAKQHWMIGSAWIISLLLCVPQAFIFLSDVGKNNCRASFQPDWGLKAYVTWFSISNFFIPLLVLIFTNGCICVVIWKTLGKNTAPQITINLQQSQDLLASNCTHLSNVSKSFDEVSPLTLVEDGRGGPLLKKVSATSSSMEVAKPRHSQVVEDASAISRAKMRSVQQTVTIVLAYIVCSTPFIYIQLWAVWGSPSKAVLDSMGWFYWFLTLNSVLNPWIYMVFNRELRTSLKRFFREKCCPSLV